LAVNKSKKIPAPIGTKPAANRGVGPEWRRWAEQRWSELGYQVRFRPHSSIGGQQFEYRVIEQCDQQHDSGPDGYLLISYPQHFDTEQFVYQNIEAWAAASGQLSADDCPDQRLRARAEILIQLFDYCPAARERQLQRTKQRISELGWQRYSADDNFYFLAPRIQALAAWELLTIISKVDQPLAKRLDLWRQQQ
jgi:hypothetical protein